MKLFTILIFSTLYSRVLILILIIIFKVSILFAKIVKFFPNIFLYYCLYPRKNIFGDIYDWAGEYRYVNMRKETGFTEVQNIETYLNGEFKLMNAEIGSIYSPYSLAAFLAEYYVHLMAIHPFREGNGRSCREFLREFVLAKTKYLPLGQYELDWTRFDGDVVLNNVQFSMVFRSQIENEFFKALVPVEPEEKNEIKM